MTVAGIASEVRTDDEGLVAAVRRGDDRAFEQLYGRYQRRIGAYVYGMVGDHGRSEDLVQEIFVAALRRMRATERPIAFKPWIYEIARNACIDQFRRTRRTEEVSFDAEEAAGSFDSGRISPSDGPDDAVHAKQQLDDLCGAFGGLSDSHHEILVLRELEGLSYREIGERLGLSRPSVESTLFRARKRLTEEYEELVSGERCRRVSEMLGAGGQQLGTRDERRLAKHVAHCQPCRRQAYAAGVDTAVLQPLPRRVVARVAALLPIPAFLRLQNVATVAEPAAGWTKAAVAAAVIVAGGAGVAGQSHAPLIEKSPVGSAPAQVEPVSQRASNAVRRITTGRLAPTTSATAKQTPASAPRQQQQRQAVAPALTDPAKNAFEGTPAAKPVSEIVGDAAPPAPSARELPRSSDQAPEVNFDDPLFTPRANRATSRSPFRRRSSRPRTRPRTS